MSTTTLSNPKTNGAGANGDGRRRPRRTPKGRQVDPAALAEVARCSARASAAAIF